MPMVVPPPFRDTATMPMVVPPPQPEKPVLVAPALEAWSGFVAGSSVVIYLFLYIYIGLYIHTEDLTSAR